MEILSLILNPLENLQSKKNIIKIVMEQKYFFTDRLDALGTFSTRSHSSSSFEHIKLNTVLAF